MKRAIAGLVFVACARASPPPSPPPVQPQPAIAPIPVHPKENEVVRRIVSGGEIYARLESSCETLVVAAGRTPEERALEIDTSELIGCTTKRKTGILLDVTAPKRMRCTGSRHQTATRATTVAACPVGEQDSDTTTPRTIEAVIAGVRLFADRTACEAAPAPPTVARTPTCFESALVNAVEQRKDGVPSGDFVTRFDAFIDNPSSTVWARASDQGQTCVEWRTSRTGGGFELTREYKEKRESVVSTASFGYDAKCKRVTMGTTATTWTSPTGQTRRGLGMSGGSSMSLSKPERDDALPFQSGQWFYTRRACERSPRD